MKKSLVALAVLGAFAGAASAQSSVTIYGVLDMGIQKTNGGTATNPGAVGGAAGKAYQLRQSTTSRLGFRGTEDMGGGLSAQFQIEHRFQPDTGAQNNAGSFWEGRSFVQLTSAGLGSLYMGRDYDPAFWIQLKSDPFGNDGVGSPTVGATYAGYTASDPAVTGNAAALSARTSNTIGVKSASFGGLTAQAAVSLSENTQRGRQTAFNLEYAAGPLYAGGAYEKFTDGSQDGNSIMNFAVHYDLGFVKPMAYYARSKTGLNGANTNHVWMLAATAPLAGGTVKAMWYKVDPRFANNTRTKLGLGYNYNLSKRTNLYADMGLAREDSRTKNNAFGFGVRHYF